MLYGLQVRGAIPRAAVETWGRSRGAYSDKLLEISHLPETKRFLGDLCVQSGDGPGAHRRLEDREPLPGTGHENKYLNTKTCMNRYYMLA